MKIKKLARTTQPVEPVFFEASLLCNFLVDGITSDVQGD